MEEANQGAGLQNGWQGDVMHHSYGHQIALTRADENGFGDVFAACS